jgi:hypothetical protein
VLAFVEWVHFVLTCDELGRLISRDKMRDIVETQPHTDDPCARITL